MDESLTKAKEKSKSDVKVEQMPAAKGPKLDQEAPIVKKKDQAAYNVDKGQKPA